MGLITFFKPAFFLFDQDLTLAGVIGLSDDSFQFHALHQRRRTVISDLQPALDVAGRGLAVALYDLHRLGKQVGFSAPHAGGIEHRAVLVGRLFRGDRFEIFRLALAFEVANDLSRPPRRRRTVRARG